MNTTAKLVAAVAASLALAGAAHADEQAAYPSGAHAARAGAAAAPATAPATAPAVAAGLGETAAYPGATGTTSALSRAQVQAEVQSARRADALRVDEAGYPAFAGQVNGRSL